MSKTIIYRIDGLDKSNWIVWKTLTAKTLKAARREFAEFLRAWTPQGKANFKLVRVTTTVRDFPA